MLTPLNAYPNDMNYGELSFPQEVTAPDEDPDDPDLETMLVEYNPAWSPVLAAACAQMLQFASWKGTDEEKLLAVNRANNLISALMTPADIDTGIPAPYWDSESDVDDELPEDEQPWYGLVENPDAPPGEVTFIQNAVIWILTGFVALVLSPSLPIGAAAAVSFRTLANRFTLAFNRGDVREQFRVIIDAKDYGEADTEGLEVGDIIEMDINGIDEAAYHDILIVRKTP